MQMQPTLFYQSNKERDSEVGNYTFWSPAHPHKWLRLSHFLEEKSHSNALYFSAYLMYTIRVNFMGFFKKKLCTFCSFGLNVIIAICNGLKFSDQIRLTFLKHCLHMIKCSTLCVNIIAAYLPADLPERAFLQMFKIQVWITGCCSTCSHKAQPTCSVLFKEIFDAMGHLLLHVWGLSLCSKFSWKWNALNLQHCTTLQLNMSNNHNMQIIDWNKLTFLVPVNTKKWIFWVVMDPS